ncbi:ImmA/IrrE family metallo-endopeptidase [Bacillaceae bacterium W0354]
MARVSVEPSVLLWAVERAGGIQSLEKRFPKINEWISGEMQPTLKQLETFAKAIAAPLGYFFLDEPPKEELSVPYYRTLDQINQINPSPELLDTLKMMEQRRDWMRDYLIELGNEPLRFVGSVNDDDSPKDVARLIREEMGMKKGWASECSTWEDALRLLIKKIEMIGIMVSVNSIVGNNTRRKLNVSEFRGFVLVDEYAPLIFINGADGKAAQMFTLAHELAHIWFGLSGIFDLENLQPSEERIEQLCNETAAEFLVPQSEMLNLWQQIKGEKNPYQVCARYFKVSELVIIRRLLDLNLITKDEYLRFYKERTIVDLPKIDSGPDFYTLVRLRVGRIFSDAIINDTRSGNTLYRDAYRLLGISGETFERYAQLREEENFS